jgi:hypothetical protein
MFDDAIRTVSVEPTEKWPLIDLTAVLSTRAHLFTERAIWEPSQEAQGTRREAAITYKRLAVAPFIEATRTQALDILCFDSVEIGDQNFAACLKAADSGNLGGAVLARASRDPSKLDLARLARLEKLRDDVGRFPRGATAAVVVRGDESELITWARPAARIISAIAKRGLNLIVVDRTRTPRARALVDRTLELAETKSFARINAQDGTLAVPCLAAILASRRTPFVCPLDGGLQSRLARKTATFAIALLIGRDLDAEIDDFGLYGLRTVLLSFRLPRIEKGLDVTLKSLSDVWIVSPLEETGSP